MSSHKTRVYAILIKIQPDATVCRYLFTAKSLYMFRVSQQPSSEVLKTVTTASGTGHNTGTATTRCNSMQIFIYCKVTLHVSGVTAPIIRSTKNSNHSLRYRSQYWYSYFPPTWPHYDLYRRLWLQFLVLLMMGAVTPETRRVTLHYVNICMLLDLVGFLLT